MQNGNMYDVPLSNIVHIQFKIETYYYKKNLYKSIIEHIPEYRCWLFCRIGIRGLLFVSQQYRFRKWRVTAAPSYQTELRPGWIRIHALQPRNLHDGAKKSNLPVHPNSGLPLLSPRPNEGVLPRHELLWI